jgi:hypothetical protein
MPYSQKIIDEIAKTPKSLGTQLGRWAIHHDFSVVRISKQFTTGSWAKTSSPLTSTAPKSFLKYYKKQNQPTRLGEKHAKYST